jgi:NAD(P)-dependent dehydrogenase (short-subunit alcohol dehydrogenase family)
VPGVIATDVWSTLYGGDETAKEQLAGIASILPVGRVGTADDIAKAVSFLVDNTYVNGISLVVDGGHRLV